jgi:hypothetical protein
MSMDPKTHLAALCAGLVLGGAAVWTLTPSPAPVEQTTFVAAADAPAAPVAAPAAPKALPKDASCEETLGQIKAALVEAQQGKSEAASLSEHLEELLLKSGGGSRDGIKQVWPEGLEERYTPAGFTAAMEEIKRACPKEFPPETKVSCEEFPCAIQLVHPGAGRDWDGLKTCKKFGELFGQRTSWSSNGMKDLEGRELAISHIMPIGEQKEIQEFMREYEGNLTKRRRARLGEFEMEQRRAMFEGPCQDGSAPAACQQAANAYRESDPDKYADLLGRGCELGDGGACNNVAWRRCHDDKICDNDALAAAERAAELNPDDGKGALDTLAYVLCASGRRAEANAAYERSCAAGEKGNCGKKCGQ